MVSENTHTSTIAVYNSFTGDTIGYVPQSTEKDVLDALDLAKIGEAIGRKMPASKRIAIIKKAVTLMELECDVLSNLIATEGIKTIVQARKEVTRAINTMQLSAEEAGRIIGATIPLNTVPAQLLTVNSLKFIGLPFFNTSLACEPFICIAALE